MIRDLLQGVLEYIVLLFQDGSKEEGVWIQFITQFRHFLELHLSYVQIENSNLQETEPCVLQSIPSTIRVLERHSPLLRFSRKEVMSLVFEKKITFPKRRIFYWLQEWVLWMRSRWLHQSQKNGTVQNLIFREVTRHFWFSHGTNFLKSPVFKTIHCITKNQVHGPTGPTNKNDVGL